MDSEIRFRVPSDFHAAAVTAAAVRGVPLSALVAIALHEYLHERAALISPPSLASAQPVAPTPAPVETNSRPIPPNLTWLTNADGSRYYTDANDDDWAEEELRYLYGKGRDPLGYYT